MWGVPSGASQGVIHPMFKCGRFRSECYPFGFKWYLVFKACNVLSAGVFDIWMNTNSQIKVSLSQPDMATWHDDKKQHSHKTVVCLKYRLHWYTVMQKKLLKTFDFQSSLASFMKSNHQEYNFWLSFIDCSSECSNPPGFLLSSVTRTQKTKGSQANFYVKESLKQFPNK